MQGAISWRKAQVIEGRYVQSAWYDHTFYKVPFRGTFNRGAIINALNSRVFRPSGSAAGGFCSAADAKDLGDGTCEVEVLYHIGD